MRLIVLSLIVSTYLLLVSSAQNLDKPECKKDGDYCQNHWECCSNSCFSYVYKCVKSSPQPAANYPPIGVAPLPEIANNAPQTTLEELIANLFAPTDRPALSVGQQILLASRIGESDSADGVSLPECLQVGQKCFKDSECCTQRCHGFLHQCVT